ncbi:MAG: ribonuclease HII [Lentisphaerae bacterium]|nr:ribonuclease HII [Lentisphaerota bacterium]
MLRFERQYWHSGVRRLAGVDEAGRGPLAGPVVAAAVVFEPSFAEKEENGLLTGLTDSKKLSLSAREKFAKILWESPFVDVGVGFADVEEIDELNILNASHIAMARAVRRLPRPADYIIVDGLEVKGLPHASTPIIRGDSKSLSIAAASVIAKVTRDSRMSELDRIYPQYGFAAHKGYGTKFHIQALFEYGPSPVHRKSFRPVREADDIRRRIKEGQRQNELGMPGHR